MLIDKGAKFKYFYRILKEVYKIIEINWEMKEEDIDKLINIINSHLTVYNEKYAHVRMSGLYDEDKKSLTIFLSDYVPTRGMKKLFKDTIYIKSIHRDKFIDDLLGEDESNYSI